MTGNEIIKALESLLDKMRAYESSQASIGKGLVEDIISEIEKLNVELAGMRGACESYKMHYDKSQTENKELWGERNRIYESLQETKLDLEEYRKAYSRAKSEAAKKFAERLKEKLYGCPTIYNSHFARMIDNLLKEMEGD